MPQLLDNRQFADRQLDDRQVADYRRDGYVIARKFFDAEETDLLRCAAKEDRELDRHSFGRTDGEGGTVRLSLWNQPGDGIYGMFARCERMVHSAEKLLAGEVYHYHSKMIMKDPRVGEPGHGIRITVTGTKTASSGRILRAFRSPSIRPLVKTVACR